MIVSNCADALSRRRPDIDSGHSGQVTNRNNSEEDGMDESAFSHTESVVSLTNAAVRSDHSRGWEGSY